MASLTVRQLDEALKQQLRLRAARNGRSVEDEVRTILRSAASEGAGAPIAGPVPPAQSANGPAAQPAAEATTRRILLIIGGGIAAYKSLDLIRRLRERGLGVRVVMTAAAQKFITPLVGRRDLRRARCSPTCSIPRVNSTSDISACRAKRS